MDHKNFQLKAIRTESVATEIDISESDRLVFENVLQSLIALSEVLDIYKKHIFYGREIDHEAVLEHLRAADTYAMESAFQAEDALHGAVQEQSCIEMDIRVFHALLGTITEHGELAIALSNGLNTGELDLYNVCEELGDSDWYKGLFYEATGISWDTVQEMIIKKLEIRFSDKIFTEGEANERDLEAERKLLEDSIRGAVDEYKSRTK